MIANRGQNSPPGIPSPLLRFSVFVPFATPVLGVERNRFATQPVAKTGPPRNGRFAAGRNRSSPRLDSGGNASPHSREAAYDAGSVSAKIALRSNCVLHLAPGDILQIPLAGGRGSLIE